jgi:hypothetical protein
MKLFGEIYYTIQFTESHLIIIKITLKEYYLYFNWDNNISFELYGIRRLQTSIIGEVPFLVSVGWCPLLIKLLLRATLFNVLKNYSKIE